MLLTNTSMESGTSKGPTCFVYTDESGNLSINTDALDQLKEPFLVVSLCGLEHDCKDSILSQLLGSRSYEFRVTSTRQTEAKRIWMWYTSLKKTTSDGTAYNVLLLYDAGIQASDQKQTCTSRICTLAVLVSRLFMHNQVCVSERTKHEQVGGIVMTGPILAGITTSFLNALNSGEISTLRATDIDNAMNPVDDISSEKRSSKLTSSVEDKIELLHKKLESSEKIKNEYQKHYEHAIDDLKNLSNGYNSQICNLDKKCSSLQERCSNLLDMLDTEKQESFEWKRKYEEIFTEVREIHGQRKAKSAILKPEDHEAEARIVAANEKARSAQEEACQLKAKYRAVVHEIAVIKNEAALTLERSNEEARQREAALQAKISEMLFAKNEVALTLERSSEEAKHREAALQAKISEILLAKDEEIKNMAVKLKNAEERLSSLSLCLKDMEAKMVNFVSESSDCKLKIEDFAKRVEVVEGSVSSVEKIAEMVPDGAQLEQKYVTELKRFEEKSDKCKVSQEEIIMANEFIEAARSQLLTAQNELRSTHQLAAERLSQIEVEQRHLVILERQNHQLADKVQRLLVSEASATSKISLLDTMIKRRDEEIESLKQKHGQSVNQAVAEHAESDHAEAIKMPKTPSLEHGTQGKTDRFLDSENSSEPTLDSAIGTPVHVKRSRLAVSDMSFDSSQDACIDETMVTKLKKPKLETPLQDCTFTQVEDSSLQQNEGGSETPNASSADYRKYTVKKLKREISQNGFTAELLALKNPRKQDIVALYEKLVMKK